MIDLWTLPKAERNSIENKIKQLEKSLTQSMDQVQRLQNALNFEIAKRNQKKAELDVLVKKYQFNSEYGYLKKWAAALNQK